MAHRQRTGVATASQAILTDDPGFLRLIVEQAVQEVLEAEMTAHLHAEPYEQNNEKALVLALMEMYVEGVSTRKVREITEALCGTSFSKSLVSELAGQLDAELGAWRDRPLTEMIYPYLSVDARYEHVRQGGQIVSHGVLIVAGVRADGHREILAVRVADTESEATYHRLFGDLKDHGVSGVRLVTSDSHQGRKAAIDRHVQGASWQRCQVHFFSRSPGHGRCRATPEVGGRPARNLRGDDARAGTDDGRRRRGTLRINPSGGRATDGGRSRGLSGLSRIPFGPSPLHSHHEWTGTAQRRDLAAHAGGAHLPECRRLPAARDSVVR